MPRRRHEISPEEATFWYNVTPRQDGKELSVPCRRLFRYSWRVPYDVNGRKAPDEGRADFAVGDDVWVKPAVPSCTKQWMLGSVTGVISGHVIAVDGMPRHVRDVRKRVQSDAAWDVIPHPDSGEQEGDWEDFDPFPDPAEPAEDVIDDERGGNLGEIAAPDQAGPVQGESVPRRSNRERRPPQWLNDYVT